MSSKEPSLITTDLIIVSVVFPVLSTFAILLRFKARSLTRASLRADDWWILVTWVFTFSLSINVWIFSHKIGIDYLKVDTLTGNKLSALCLVVSSLLTQFDLTTVKIAILLFYKRIFSTYKFKIAAWTAIGAVGCWGIIVFFVILFQGDPQQFIVNGKQEFRLDPIAVGYSQVAGTVALDFLVLLFPLPVIFRLRLPLKKKIGVALIFWLGIFCCVAALIRVVLIHRVHQKIIDAHGQIAIQSQQFIFLLVEPHCSIIAACLPCYAPIFGVGRDFFMRSVKPWFTLESQTKVADSPRGVPITSAASSTVGLNTSNSAWAQTQHEVHVYPAPESISPDNLGENVALQDMKTIKVTSGVEVSRT